VLGVYLVLNLLLIKCTYEISPLSPKKKKRIRIEIQLHKM